MKSRFLFPHKFRYLGYLLVIPGFILGYLVLNYIYELPDFRLPGIDAFKQPMPNLTKTFALALVIVGLLLIGFSKLKREDELTAKIRLNALYWGILVNNGVYAFLNLISVFRSAAFNISDSGNYLDYNLFTPLLIFIAVYYQLYRRKNEFTIRPIHFLPNRPYNLVGKLATLVALLPFLAGLVFDNKYLELGFNLLPLSLLLWAYSKEKSEDEYVDSIRLEAMQIAVYVNYGMLILADLFVYSLDFITVEVISLITIPLIFIGWFQFRLYSLNKLANLKTMLI